MAVIAAAVGAVKAGAISKVAEGVSGLFGDTATDKARVATANDLLAQALQGSEAALGQLIFNAYEPRRGAAGDSRTPVDGKYSPQAVRDLAVKALRQYVQAKGGLPEKYSTYAARLNADILPGPVTAADQVLEVVREGIRQGTAQGTVTYAQDTARKAAPWATIALVAVAAVVAWRLLRD